jgi:hypothetical protein
VNARIMVLENFSLATPKTKEFISSPQQLEISTIKGVDGDS